MDKWLCQTNEPVTQLCVSSDGDSEKIYPHHTPKSLVSLVSCCFLFLFFVYRPPLTAGQTQTIIRSFDYSKSIASCAATKYFLGGHLGYYCNQIR